MRIISGKYKGYLIETINDSSTRPMMSKAREGIFNSLQNEFNNSTVLDLYAGSGSLGIESLSRGADFVTFIELSTKCSKIINKNLQKMEVNFTVLETRVSEYINQSHEKFDIIFYDPPFSTSNGEIDNELIVVQDLMNINSKLVVHRHKSSDQFVYPNGLELYREKNYGQSKITILKKWKF